MTRDDDNSPITSESFQELKKKSLAGMGALFVRQVLVKVIFFIGNIVLARILAPEIFGIYAIVNFVVTFFSTFGDVGIGAALIQKKGELSREELSTTFWLQQMLVWLVVGVVVFAAPLALKVYTTLPPVGVWLIRAMAVSFLFSSLKTIPAILMEREIDFKRIAWVDITENLVFQCVAITGAVLGWEAWSFVAAAVARALLGAVLIFVVSPWRPTFLFRFESVRGLVRFGLPYQGNQILSFVKDAVTPLFVGAYAGAAAVGFLNWARNFAFAPLVLSETFGRVAFPAFSKLQNDRELLGSAVERSIRIITLIMFPITGLMIALAPELTHLIFTDKWLPGLPAFYLYCTAPAVIGISLPLYSGILAVGNSGVILKMTTALLFIEWGLGVPLVLNLGFNGMAVTQPVTIFAFTWIYWYVLKQNKVDAAVISNVYKNFVFTVVAAAVIVAAKFAVSSYWTHLVLFGCIYAAVYTLLSFVFNRNTFLELFDYVRMVAGTAKKLPEGASD